MCALSICPSILFKLVFILIIVGVLGFVFLRQRRLLSGLVLQLGASPSGYSGAANGIFEGMAYTCAYSQGGRNSPPSLKLGAACCTDGKLVCRSENVFDRFFKRADLAVEVQTHDERFDTKIYIRSDSPNFAAAYLASAEKRAALLALKEMGFSDVVLTGKKVEVSKQPFRLDEGSGADTVRRAVAQLAVLCRQLPDSYQKDDPVSVGQAGVIRIGLHALVVLVMMAGFAFILVGHSDYEPVDAGAIFSYSLKMSVPLTGVFLALAFWLLKGRSSFHKDLGTLVIFSIISFPLFVYSFLVWKNGAEDRNPPLTYSTLIVDRSYSHSKSSYHYYVHVRSWSPGGGIKKLRVSQYDYKTVRPGQSYMQIVTRAGSLGFEWYVSKRRQK